MGVYCLVVMLSVLLCLVMFLFSISAFNCLIPFCFFTGQLLMGVRFYRLHSDQVELLYSLCSHLHISHSFFIRELIDHYSSESFERINPIRLKNESHRITSLSNKNLLFQLKKPNSNLGKSYPTNKPNPNKPN